MALSRLVGMLTLKTPLLLLQEHVGISSKASCLHFLSTIPELDPIGPPLSLQE
jgi:hypothetical protein